MKFRIMNKREEPMLEWRKHPNPYLQLHLQVYPRYLKEIDAGTYDATQDPFCSNEYILNHPLLNSEDISRELKRKKEGGKK